MSDENEIKEASGSSAVAAVIGIMWVLVGSLVAFICGVAWLAGFVLAKGFWSTVFCVIPFWSWYLVVEKIMIHFNWV